MRGQHNTRCVTGEFYLRSKSDLRSVLLITIGLCPSGMFHGTVIVPIRNMKVHSPGPRFLQRRYKARHHFAPPLQNELLSCDCPPQTLSRPVTFESFHVLSRVVQSGPHLRVCFGPLCQPRGGIPFGLVSGSDCSSALHLAVGRTPPLLGLACLAVPCIHPCCWP